MNRNKPGFRRALPSVLALAVLATSAFPVSAEENLPQWEVAEDAARVVVVARAMGAPIEGTFDRMTAAVRFDPRRIGESHATVEIDMNSFSSANADIEREIKKKKWFDVETHPSAHFETTSFRALGDGRYEAVGQLTVKGVTRDLTVPFNLSPGPPGDLSDSASVSAEFSINRTDFNIGEGEWTDTNLVADEVVVRIEAQGARLQ